MSPLDLQQMVGNSLTAVGVDSVILLVQCLFHSEQLFIGEKYLRCRGLRTAVTERCIFLFSFSSGLC